MGHGSCGSRTGQLNDESCGLGVTKCDPLLALPGPAVAILSYHFHAFAVRSLSSGSPLPHDL